jgi:hypothetical protein
MEATMILLDLDHFYGYAQRNNISPSVLWAGVLRARVQYFTLSTVHLTAMFVDL